MFSPKSPLKVFDSIHPNFSFINADICYKTSFSCSVHNLYLCFSLFADINATLTIVSISLFYSHQGLCHPDDIYLNFLLANIKSTILCYFQYLCHLLCLPIRKKQGQMLHTGDECHKSFDVKC